ncbi:hypothetical protein SEVIR_5G337400v4 [Setaria viridis]|uniref:Copper transport protein n=1 Tax=Setaria viridis TaxID=4556 RepID=A0A4U6USL0_SETVI|nr:LOW QUALITY PROTEIN: copper transporter 3-like [Setaria italica]XP_034598236.1 copper transporter 3-like [Setaria viridis]TKW17009.1 hypothetical protein SEVIR_5G337400v2 [Setaria viridis]
MDMGGGHHHMGAMAPAPFPPGGAHGGGMGMRRKRYIHMTFYWGKNSEILFTLWPGADGGMYALALVAVFALAVLLEFLGSRRLDSLLPTAAAGANKRVAAGAARAAVHALRMGGAYLLMLALMSFNGGVLLVAVAGHAAGFLAFRAGLCGHGRAQVEGGCNKEEHAPAACC